MRYPVAPVRLLFAVILLAVSSSAFAGWQILPGRLSQVSVGDNTWGVAPDDTIWYWSGTNWVKIDGTLYNIAAGNDGTLWGAQRGGNVFRRDSGEWKQLPGKVTQVSVGNASNIWAIGLADDVYKWNASVGNWDHVEGSLMWIAAGSDGTVWGVQRGGNVFRRDGVSWTYITGGMANISVGNASNVWAVNPTGEIFRWDGGKFVRIVGGLKQVSVGANGGAFGVASDGQVYYAAPASVPDAAPSYVLTVNAAAGGRVISNPAGISCGTGSSGVIETLCSTTFKTGSTIRLTAEPADAFAFAGYNGDCSGTTPSCDVLMDAGKTVAAAFASQPATLTIIPPTGGIITLYAPAPPTYQRFSRLPTTGGEFIGTCPGTCFFQIEVPGFDYSVGVSPGPGYAFAGWTGDCTGTTTSRCILKMDRRRTIGATFVPSQ